MRWIILALFVCVGANTSGATFNQLAHSMKGYVCIYLQERKPLDPLPSVYDAWDEFILKYPSVLEEPNPFDIHLFSLYYDGKQCPMNDEQWKEWYAEGVELLLGIKK